MLSGNMNEAPQRNATAMNAMNPLRCSPTKINGIHRMPDTAPSSFSTWSWSTVRLLGFPAWTSFRAISSR